MLKWFRQWRDLRSGDPSVRVLAVFELAKTRSETNLRAALQALQDPDANVRQAAAYTLGDLGYSTAVAALVAALRQASTGEDQPQGVAPEIGAITSALLKLGAAEAVLDEFRCDPLKSTRTDLWFLYNALAAGPHRLDALVFALEYGTLDVSERALKLVATESAEVTLPALARVLARGDAWKAAAIKTYLFESGSVLLNLDPAALKNSEAVAALQALRAAAAGEAELRRAVAEHPKEEEVAAAPERWHDWYVSYQYKDDPANYRCRACGAWWNDMKGSPPSGPCPGSPP